MAGFTLITRDWVSEIYTRGGWISGGKRSIILGEGLLLSQGDGNYTWAGNQNIQDAYVFLTGDPAFYDNSYTINQGIYFELQYSQGEWSVNGLQEVSENANQ
ncbi:DUF6318 family protein [Rothia nasisuis]|uniref:DUF6318 family protein n=1 Tax=Rothia nasisuis TaxID=2109647 RepID=UPI001F45E3DD|nr:DUF6318 family protein [Rothia nasisuis]